ncbi:MAG: (5-formylfuran-3-yl)methyl phosphate synthase [candidate division Zixibacteria bacterium]|nr:(5-formylfuran-3-yl)methyl phosphate synthase [candidate division Zixibacteria bacterium]
MCKNTMRQKLLISVRGKKEAIDAYRGGAHIIDVEYPKSALGTPYPLNIQAVRKALPGKIKVATNIGEEQRERRSTACQAVLGVALAGADIIKVGLAGYSYKEASYLGRSVVRTIKHWFPRKKVIPAVFADKDKRKFFDPIKEGPKLGKRIKADGILIDTFSKRSKQNRLTNLLTLEEIIKFVSKCHSNKLEAWIAGSITVEEIPKLWKTGVDVICVRGAACKKGTSRMSKISRNLVEKLIATIPSSSI